MLSDLDMIDKIEKTENIQVESTLNKLLFKLINFEWRISDRTIIEHTKLQKRTVMRSINNNIELLKSWGTIEEAFDYVQTIDGIVKEKTYFFTKHQALQLLSYMKRTDHVLDLIVDILKEQERLEPIAKILKTDQEVDYKIEDELKSYVTHLSELIEILKRQYKPFGIFNDAITKQLDKYLSALGDEYWKPAEIAEITNKKVSAVNRLLESKDYQIQENGVWIMTEKGREFGVELNGNLRWLLRSVL